MICPRCNTQLSNGATVCPVCALPIAEVAAEKENAAQQGADKKEEKVYYGYGKEFSNTKYNKKKRRRRVWKVAIPVILAAAVVAAVLFNIDFIVGFYKKTFCSPGEYFEYVSRRDMGDDHGENIRGYISDIGDAADGAVEIRLERRVYEAFREDVKRENRATPYFGIDGLDMLGFKAVSDEVGTQLGLYTKDRAYTVLDLVGDSEKKGDRVPVNIKSGHFVFYDAKVTAEELKAALPDNKQLNELTEKYLKIMFKHCTGVKKATEVFDIGGVDQELVMLEVNFGRTDMLNLKEELFTEFKNDKVVIKTLERIGEAAKKSGTVDKDYDIKKAFDDELAGVLAEIEEARTNVGIIVNSLRYRIFVNGGHEVVGREITVADKRELYYLVTSSDDEIAAEIKLGDITGVGFGTMKDGILNGEFEVESDGVELMDITAKNFDISGDSDAVAGGKLKFKPKTRFIHDLNLPTDFSWYEVACELSFNDGKMIIDLFGEAKTEEE